MEDTAPALDVQGKALIVTKLLYLKKLLDAIEHLSWPAPANADLLLETLLHEGGRLSACSQSR